MEEMFSYAEWGPVWDTALSGRGVDLSEISEFACGLLPALWPYDVIGVGESWHSSEAAAALDRVAMDFSIPGFYGALEWVVGSHLFVALSPEPEFANRDYRWAYADLSEALTAIAVAYQFDTAPTQETLDGAIQLARRGQRRLRSPNLPSALDARLWGAPPALPLSAGERAVSQGLPEGLSD